MALNEEQYNYNNNNNEDHPEEYISGDEFRQNTQNLTPQIKRQTGWQQKFAVVFLALFGLSALILWVVQFNSGLKVTQPLTEEELAALQKDNTADLEALRNQDTDKDGLSDYNELYLYNTSPYLEDTDSDGIGDKVEIDEGEDPNCPIGQNCFSETDGVNSQIGDIATSSANVSSDNGANIDYSTTTQSEDEQRAAMQKILEGGADAASLRAMLKESGMSEDFLNQISDEQLLDMYEKTLTSQE